ncbi:MAG: hypothetical protein ACSHYA_18985 [Opitutaceae bacterium]
MKIPFIALIAILLVGCESDTTQADILKHLIEPFSINEQNEDKESKILNLKTRNNLSPDSTIIDYQISSKLIEMNKEDFCDSMVVLVSMIVNDPQKGMLKIDEEWYHSSHQFDPLLLRRQIFGIDQKKYIYESWAEETVMNILQSTSRSDQHR